MLKVGTSNTTLNENFEEAGFYVIRSAGSHGVFDLIAIKNGKPYGIQCKKGSFGEKLLHELKQVGEKFGIYPLLIFSENKRVRVLDLRSRKVLSLFEFLEVLRSEGGAKSCSD